MPRLREYEAGQMTETPNHNEHLEVAGIIGNIRSLSHPGFPHAKALTRRLSAIRILTFFNFTFPVLVEFKEYLL
jgi:hypothetical protein